MAMKPFGVGGTGGSVVADALPGLEGHTACLIGDYMLVYGGKTASHALSGDAFALNLTSLEWRRLRCSGGSVPMPRAYHSANVFGWKMFVFGGLLAVGVDDVHYNMYNAFANVDALDAQVLERRGAERLREPRTLRKVTQQKKELSALHVLDLENEPTWTDVATFGVIPPPRAHHATTIHRSTLYLYGGYSVYTTGRATDEELKAVYCVYALNLHTLTWSVIEAVNSVPPKLWGMASITSGDVWVLHGGVDITQCAETAAVCAWHLEQGEWRWLQAAEGAPPPISMHKAVRFGDKMIVFGGASDVSSVLYNETYVLDLLAGTWIHVKTTGEPPLARHGHTMVVAGYELLVFGGMDYSLTRSSRVWSLDLRTFVWSVVAAQFSAGDIDNVRGITRVVAEKFAPTFLPATPTQKRTDEAVQTLPTLGYGDVFSAADEILRGPATFASVRPAAMQQLESGSKTPPATMASQMAPPPRRDPTDPRNRTEQYAVAWSTNDDVMHGMRTDIAKTKSVLSNMLDAAAARAARESSGLGPSYDRLLEPNRDGTSTLDKTRADEARRHLGDELSARTARVRDLAQVASTDGASSLNVQQYWKAELDALAEHNEVWRQATVRENALMEDAERRHLLSGQQRSMLARKMVPAGALVSRTHADAMQTSSEAMFPHSSASRLSDSGAQFSHHHVHDPIKLAPVSKKHFVSPSLVKLGLTGQLGQRKGLSGGSSVDVSLLKSKLQT